ncbi:MAG: alpha/beta hydrolase [Tabrizicola sp.]|jgi:hypothetical protein|nr:alpha/beta hydrolase [Tabrizicola sp.]
MLLLKLGLLAAGSLYAAAVSAMFFLQRDLQYFPTKRDPSPESLGLSGVERVELATADGETVVLWFVPPDEGQPVVLYLHGNAGETADRADRLALYQARGFGAAFLSWRGYGGSTGRPTEAGLMADAEAALAFLEGRGYALGQIALVGESLGTGVAVQLAARHPVGALVLEAPYTAAVDVAARAYPWVPVRLLMKDQFRSRAHIGQVRSPLLVLHGERDRVIPFAMGRALFDQAGEPKTFLSLGPVGHEALFDPATWETGADFIARMGQP